MAIDMTVSLKLTSWSFFLEWSWLVGFGGLNMNAVIGREVGVTKAKTWKKLHKLQDKLANKTHTEIPPDVDKSGNMWWMALLGRGYPATHQFFFWMRWSSCHPRIRLCNYPCASSHVCWGGRIPRGSGAVWCLRFLSQSLQAGAVAACALSIASPEKGLGRNTEHLP